MTLLDKLKDRVNDAEHQRSQAVERLLAERERSQVNRALFIVNLHGEG